MNKEVMFSSATGVWATPQDFFDSLDAEFNFTLDPCVNDENHKCEKYFTEAEDGLAQDWGGLQGILQSALWPGAVQMG